MPVKYENDTIEMRQTFGRKIQEILSNKGLNQSDLAKTLRVSRNTINAYVRGQSLPSPASLVKLAEHFDMSTEDLLPVTVRRPEQPSMTMKITDDGNAFLTINKKLTQSTAAKIVTLVSEDTL